MMVQNPYIEEFKKKYSKEYVFSVLDELQKTKVLVVGEAILDQYTFGQTIGKSAKEPIVVLKELHSELYAGGSLAMANHLSSFCKEVGLFAMLGDTDSREQFVRKSLRKNVQPNFFYKKNSPTIIKRRYIEMHPHHKLLEVYVISESEIGEEETKEIETKLESLLKKYDVVICADFGHYMQNDRTRKVLMEKSKFLAANTQANAGNMGYHTLSNYPKADFVCADEREIRLEMRKKNGDVKDIITDVGKKFKYKNFIVTMGGHGCYIYTKGKIMNIPSLSSKFTDRVGAGDAFLSITSPLVRNKVPLEVVGFVGNAVGALAIEIMGNKRPVEKKELQQFITNIYSS